MGRIRKIDIDFTLIQFLPSFIRPAVQAFLIIAKNCPCCIPIMSSCMIKVNNLDRSIKLFLRNIPYPWGAIPYYTHCFSPGYSPAHCLNINPAGKRIRCFNGSDIGGGAFISQRTAFFIHGCLSKDTTQFCLSRPCLTVFPFALPANHLSLNHRHTCAIHTSIHLGN